MRIILKITKSTKLDSIEVVSTKVPSIDTQEYTSVKVYNYLLDLHYGLQYNLINSSFIVQYAALLARYLRFNLLLYQVVIYDPVYYLTMSLL